MRWALGCLLLLWLVMLAACGGGGGGSTDAPAISVSSKTLEARVPERVEPTMRMQVRLVGVPSDQTAYVVALIDDMAIGFVEHIEINAGPSNQFDVVVRPKQNLVAGLYVGSMQIALCSDDACDASVLASPVTVALRLRIDPNISVVREVVLSRQGAESSPSARIPVGIPPEAGAVQLTLEPPISEGITVSLVDGHLDIQTAESRSGDYAVDVRIVSVNDPRYQATTLVRYRVEPAVGGDRDMTVSLNVWSASVALDQRATQRVTITPASWSATRPSFEFEQGDPRYPNLVSIAHLGGDDYDVVVDATGVPAGVYSVSIRVVPAPQGGTMSFIVVNVTVSSPLHLDVPRPLIAGAASTAADLRWRTPVAFDDGVAVPWSATSSYPWLKVVQPQGVTGRDDLVVEFDVERMIQGNRTSGTAFLMLTIDRPGIPLTYLVIEAAVRFPVVQAVSPGLVDGASRTLAVSGLGLTGDEFARGTFVLEGATLRAVRPVTTMDRPALLVDIDQAQVGVPITVRSTVPAYPTTHTVDVASAPAAVAGSAAYSRRVPRPASYSSKHRAWFMAGAGTLQRMRFDGVQWQFDSVAIDGLIDAEVDASETAVLAVSRDRVRLVDPATLGTLVDAAGTGPAFVTGGWTIDTTQRAPFKTVVQTFDGVTVAASASSPSSMIRSIEYAGPFSDPGSIAYWAWRDGPYPFANTGAAMTMVASADRQAVVAQQIHGSPMLATVGSSFAPLDARIVATLAGREAVAVSGTGERVIDSAGHLHQGGTTLDLKGMLPTDRQAAGYGITADGRFALVYHDRIDASSGRDVAVDPRLAVADLRDWPAQPATWLASLAVSGPTGCTADRPQGEPCEREVSVAVDRDAGMVAVVGPRGMSIVPMPASTVPSPVLATIARSKTSSGRASLRLR